MKKLLGLAVLIAAIILGGYYVTGVVTEKTLKKNIAVINQGKGFHLDIMQYDRGWFNSSVQLRGKLLIPEHTVKTNDQVISTPAEEFTLEAPLVIHHGPIIFTDSKVEFGFGSARMKLTIPQAYQAKFASLFTESSTKPVADISLLVNYLAQTHINIQIPAFKLIAKEGGEFEWQGMEDSVILSADVDKIHGSNIIDGFSWSKNQGKIAVSQVKSSYNLQHNVEGFYTGKGKASLPLLRVTENDKDTFSMKDMEVHFNSEVSSGLYNASLNASLENLMTDTKTYGPGSFKISVKNLDAHTLGVMNHEIRNMKHGTESEQQKVMLSLLPELPKLLNKGARVEISDLKFAMPDGAIEASLAISFPSENIASPFQLIQKMSGEGKVKVPTVFLQHIMQESVKQQLTQPSLQQAMVDELQKSAENTNVEEPQDDEKTASEPVSAKPETPEELEERARVRASEKLSALVQAGLLTLKGNDYLLDFKLADGQLTLNGQPFNPAMMKF